MGKRGGERRQGQEENKKFTEIERKGNEGHKADLVPRGRGLAL